ncbi:MAG: hypothetical protein L0L39_03195 [Atopostipes suicloacalis]|nr:hypothetical protein [Atopostipes suicloacalis]MDN6731168.1 hypothetical protein [Atopostipes suicloacalis]
MTLLESMDFNNTYTLVVTEELSKEHQLEKIPDLEGLTDEVKVGFTLKSTDRQAGYLNIQDLYDLNFPNLTTMESKLRYSVIKTGDINLLDTYSTGSELEEYPELEEILN